MRGPKNTREGPFLAMTSQAATEGRPMPYNPAKTVITLASGGQDDR
jgi:hypothetical protein